MVLHILEKGLCPNGMTLADLDNHEKLVQVLPEFKHGSTSLVSKIIVGFKKELGADGKKVPILRDYEGKVTLRMLLTHTSGLAYYYEPTDGTPPLKPFPFVTGRIEDFAVRALSQPLRLLLTLEAGFENSARLSKNLGLDIYWLGQFIVRCTGFNLRQALKKYIFEPLEIPSSELDVYIPPEHAARKAVMHTQSPTGSGFISIPFDIYTSEGDPPEGYAYIASGPLFGTIEAYTRILAETTWKLAIRDALAVQGIKLEPQKVSSCPLAFHQTFHFGQAFKSTIPGKGTGINLLQCEVAIAPTVSGRPPGSYGMVWTPQRLLTACLDIWYAIDEVTGKGYIYNYGPVQGSQHTYSDLLHAYTASSLC
ncbi:hypothetical protein BS47DRAFT_1336893 [Hydnum rufescens UP504]|uniref:Beta-lactamase-related domain-containing protein n=1 Tax=Hydnum rufescens UP504 TaxID=1448309 RepID=A0A9P6E213_9AGAM|nr:hypothetical protein BS47DRAFT_1336893 [Hydnum rufescens UP504]